MKKWTRLLGIISVTCLSFSLFGVSSMQKVSAAEAAPITVAFPDFDKADLVDMLDLSRNAGNSVTYADGVLNLTKSMPGQAGSVFLDRQVRLGEDRSFSAYFEFQITPSDDILLGNVPVMPADGFTFVLSNDSANQGAATDGCGFTGFSKSVGVEFDVYNNGGGYDPSDSHVALNKNGTSVSVASHNLLREGAAGIRLSDGKRKYAWVEYDGETDTLKVAVSESRSRAAADEWVLPAAGIKTVLGDSSVYVGFTASTGSHYARTDVFNWYVDNRYAPIDEGKLANYTTSPKTVEMEVPALDKSNQTTVSLRVRELNGDPAVGLPVTLSTNRGTLSETTVITDSTGRATVSFENNTPGAASTAVIYAWVPGGAFASAKVACSAVSGLPTRSVYIAYDNFSQAREDFNFIEHYKGIYYEQDDVSIRDGALNISSNQQVNSLNNAFYKEKVKLGADKSFSTYFTFSMTPGYATMGAPTPTCGGFSFSLNGVGNTKETVPGVDAFGLLKVPDNKNIENVAFVFDAFQTATMYTPSDNYTKLLFGGWYDGARSVDLNTSNPSFKLANGSLRHVWIEFDGQTRNYTVTVSPTQNRADGVSYTEYSQDGYQAYLGQEVYLGFGANVYMSGMRQQIHSWYFDTTSTPIDPTKTTLISRPENVTISESYEAGNQRRITVKAVSKDGLPAANLNVTLTTDRGTFQNGAQSLLLTTDSEGKASTVLTFDPTGPMPELTAVAEGGTTAFWTIGGLGIQLEGDETMIVEIGSEFVDPGVKAYDENGADISDEVTVTGTVDTSVAGDYLLTYTVAHGGKTVSKTRLVQVRDTTPPVVTLIGNERIELEGGAFYRDKGAAAVDANDGELTDSILTEGLFRDIAYAPGSHMITYSVADSSGNVGSATRIVVVQDTKKPVLSLVGEAITKVEQHTEYVDYGAMALDDCDKYATNRVVVSGKVDTEVPGTYTLTYAASDASGNRAEPIVRKVQVIAADGLTEDKDSHSNGSDGTGDANDIPLTGVALPSVAMGACAGAAALAMLLIRRRRRGTAYDEEV